MASATGNSASSGRTNFASSRKDEKLSPELMKIQETLSRLLARENYKSKDCRNDLKFLRKKGTKYPNELAKMGLVSLFERILKTHLTDNWDAENGDDDLWNNIDSVVGMMVDGTDESNELCQAALDNKTYELIILWLKDSKLVPERTEVDSRENELVLIFPCI